MITQADAASGFRTRSPVVASPQTDFVRGGGGVGRVAIQPIDHRLDPHIVVIMEDLQQWRVKIVDLAQEPRSAGRRERPPARGPGLVRLSAAKISLILQITGLRRSARLGPARLASPVLGRH